MYFGIPLMQPAKSLVMMPASIVSMQTVSKFSQKRVSSGLSKGNYEPQAAKNSLLSSLARWARPRVHAKIEAKITITHSMSFIK